MKLPNQAPPVKRSVNKLAGVTFNGNVRPAGWLDILGKAAQGALGAVIG